MDPPNRASLMYLTPNQKSEACALSPYFPDYSRTETAFAVIGLLLMIGGHVFAWYSLREPRYMFKRLAAFMHLITGKCIRELILRTLSISEA